MQNERYHKLAALAQAGERDAAMTDGRPHGGASDGAVLGVRIDQNMVLQLSKYRY